MAGGWDTHLRHRLTRRGLLRFGLGVGGAALVLAGGGAVVLWPHAAAPGRQQLSPDDEALVRALAEAWLPPDAVLPSAAYDVVAGVDQYVAILPTTERRLLRALFRVVDQLPRVLLRSPSRLSALPLPERTALMGRLEHGGKSQRDLALFLRLLIGTALFRDTRAFAALDIQWGCPVIP